MDFNQRLANASSPSEFQQLTVGAESGERELASGLQQLLSAWDVNQSLANASLPSEPQQLTVGAFLTESLENVSLPVAFGSSSPLGTSPESGECELAQ